MLGLGMVVDHAERSHCAESRFSKDRLKLIWFKTVPNHNESVTVSRRHTHSRKGKCCWLKEREEHFTEIWETLSTGVVRSGVKCSGMKCTSYRLGCLLLITFNKSSSLEESGEGCQCAGGPAAYFHPAGQCWWGGGKPGRMDPN